MMRSSQSNQRFGPEPSHRPVWWAALILALAAVPAWGQVSFEQAPINYLHAPAGDPVAKLQKKIDHGTVRLQHDEQHGYLKSVLEQLDVSIASQVLVFSKTSFQLKRISPRSPRSIYFNDRVYVGSVQSGDVVEISSVDPRQGPMFYTLSQRETAHPKFVRRTHDCLQCHGSSLTRGVPGHLVRSVYPDPEGHPILTAGTHLTDHTSSLAERWGGWYVTGRHGSQRHLGNLVMQDPVNPNHVDTSPGANVTNLSRWFETSLYLSPHSDIIALMVLEHQTQMHNRIVQANYLTRIALRDGQVMNEMLDRPADHRSESTTNRIRAAVEPMIKYMLFCGEIELTDRIEGTSGFRREFSAAGPRDRQGRSLRDFDLTARLFKYPCSYLIYSEAFDRLPPPAGDFAYRRLYDVLSGEDTGNEFQHLSSTDRRAILQILRDTKPGLPKYWAADGP